ncbi:MAG: DUF2156 domain-containing protein [Myxococcales bacterium FL481]|nr:MAG: DUF2156 domain-containing protein [Myxococcales bacterium FL481]
MSAGSSAWDPTRSPRDASRASARSCSSAGQKLCYTRYRVTRQTPPRSDVSRRVQHALARFGDQAISAQVSGRRGLAYWFDGEACVAYRVAGRTRVVAGVPLAAPPDRVAIARRFCRVAAAAGDRVVWFGVDREFIEAAHGGAVSVDSVAIGSEPMWSLAAAHDRARGLDSQCRRARRKGVTVRVASADEVVALTGLRGRILTLLDRWYATRPMPAMDFLVRVEPFERGAAERRFYVAERGTRLDALLIASPMPASRGWFFENIIRDPHAPNGTVESLLCFALDHARERGDAVASLGLAPLARLDAGGGRHRLLRWLLHTSYRRLGTLYRFRTLHTFKARMRPHRWEPRYLAVLDGRVGLSAFLAVGRAFAGGSLTRFAVALVRRRFSPRVEHQLLTAHGRPRLGRRGV